MTTTGATATFWFHPSIRLSRPCWRIWTSAGLLRSTLVIAMGEFGRGPQVNPGNGRDHWPQCWSVVLGGGGIAGGQVVGASDEQGGYVADRQVTIGDLFATLYKTLGIDWEKTYMTPIGRPVKIANSIGDATGVPLKELI